jgi:hypothetical protein
MTGIKPQPLDRDLDAALDAERLAVFAPDDAKARVLHRVTRTLAGLPGSGTNGEGRPAEPRTLPPPSAGTLASLRPLALPLSLAAAATFGLGGLTGALWWRATHPLPSPQIVYVERERPAESAAIHPGDAAEAAPTSPTAPSLPAPGSPAASNGNSLAAERALLDVARSAFGRGDGDAALAALTRHEKLYPNGQLTEEREALAVRALVLTDRGDQARARGAKFRKRYPSSVMLPALEAALGTIP